MAFDVGGTNVRGLVRRLADEGVAEHPRATEVLRRPGGNARAVMEFVAEAAELLEEGDTIAGAAVAFAGPVSDGTARMTNWPPPSAVGMSDLVEAGLPAGRTVVLNDMVAGALGVAALVGEGGPSATTFERLREPARSGPAGTVVAASDESPRGSLVYVAPGTGLGAAVLVPCGSDGPPAWTPVACEMQHTTLPELDDEIASVADAFAAMEDRRPTWEELVSGRGLARIHALLADMGEHPVAGVGPGSPESEAAAARAGRIAADAQAGDALAVRAIGIYYRCAARFAQALALAHLPCDGVFIGGGTTRKNLALLEAAGLAEAFDDNEVLGATLRTMELCAVLDEDVNLVGALGEAVRVASG
jgi:glucokinase